MLKTKSKKQLKKMRLRMRMKRIQLLMEAIRIHKDTTEKKKQFAKKVSGNVSNALTKKIINNRIKTLKGRISSSKKRAKDLWTKR